MGRNRLVRNGYGNVNCSLIENRSMALFIVGNLRQRFDHNSENLNIKNMLKIHENTCTIREKWL